MPTPLAHSCSHLRPWRVWFILVLTVYLVSLAILRLFVSKYIEYDDAEQILFAQSLSLGYSAQPPLYTWLLWCMIQLFGANILSLLVLRIALLAAFYILLFLVARRVLFDDRLASLAALSPMLMPLFSWEIPRLTHTLLLCDACLATALALLRLCERRTTRDFVFLGLAAGVGLLSKHNYVFFVAPAFTAALSVEPFRAKLWDRRLALSALVAIAIFLPHVVWLIGHVGEAYARFDERNGESGAFLLDGFLGMGSLLANLIVGGASLGLVQWIVYHRKQSIRAKSAPSPEDHFLQRLLLGIVALWAIAVLCIGIRELRLPWLAPVLVLLPTWLLCRLRACVSEKRHRLYAGVVTAATAAVLLTQVVQVGIGYEDGKYQTRDFLLAEQALRARAAGFQTGSVIVMDPVLGGYQRLYFPSAFVDCLSYPSLPEPVPPCGSQILVVWDATKRLSLPGEVRKHLRDCFGVRLPLHVRGELVEVPPCPIESSVKRLAYLLLNNSAGRAEQWSSLPQVPRSIPLANRIR